MSARAATEGTAKVIIVMKVPFVRYFDKKDTATTRSTKKKQFQSVRSAIASAMGKNGTITRDLPIINAIAVTVNAEALEALAGQASVLKVDPDLTVQAVIDQSVDYIHAPQAWALQDQTGSALTGKGIHIAIIDTGVDYTHPDLGGCFGQGCKVVGGWDFVNNNADPVDDHGHGTHVAATAAGKGAVNGTQLYGVAPDASIVAYKVLNSTGAGYSSDIIAATNRAVDPNSDGDPSDHVDVISMSLGAVCYGGYYLGCGPADEMSVAVDNASAVGVVSAIAAGNSGPNPSTIGTPGTAATAITVAAACAPHGSLLPNYCGTNPIASFSSRGPVIYNGINHAKPDIAAPGVMICATRWGAAFPTSPTCFDSHHVRISGTSMATPHIAGVLAILKQANPAATPLELKNTLKANAINLGATYNEQGAGLANVIVPALTATPNPCLAIPTGACTTTLSWIVSPGTTIQLWVADGSNAATIMICSDKPAGSASAPWIANGHSYTFKLYKTNTCDASTIAGKTPDATVMVRGVGPAPVALLTGNGSSEITVKTGDTIQYAWSSKNGISAKGMYSTDIPVCGASGTGLYPWNFGNTLSGSGSFIIQSCSAGNTSAYFYAVTSSDGQIATSTLIVHQPPTATIDSASLTQPYGAFSLTGTAEGVKTVMVEITEGYWYLGDHIIVASDGTWRSEIIRAIPVGTYRATILNGDNLNEELATGMLTITPAPPSITADPSTVSAGNKSTIRWSAYEGPCIYASPTNSPTDASYGTYGASGQTGVGPLYIDAVYMVTCNGQSASTTVTVIPEPPVIWVDPITVPSGSRATVYWSAPAGSSCTYSSPTNSPTDYPYGSAPAEGHTGVGPLIQNATYTITCNGLSASAMVTVITPPAAPTATLTANGQKKITVRVGSYIDYAWSSTNGVSAATTYVTNSPACGRSTNGPFTLPITTLSGTLHSGPMAKCFGGHTITVTYTVTGSDGTKARSSVVETITQ